MILKPRPIPTLIWFSLLLAIELVLLFSLPELLLRWLEGDVTGAAVGVAVAVGIALTASVFAGMGAGLWGVHAALSTLWRAARRGAASDANADEPHQLKRAA